MLFISSNAHIDIPDQTFHLKHVFELRVVFLIKFFFASLQQVLSVSCFFVKLRGHKHSRADEPHQTEGVFVSVFHAFVSPCDIRPCV